MSEFDRLKGQKTDIEARNTVRLLQAERDGLGSQLLDLQQECIALRKETAAKNQSLTALRRDYANQQKMLREAADENEKLVDIVEWYAAEKTYQPVHERRAELVLLESALALNESRRSLAHGHICNLRCVAPIETDQGAKARAHLARPAVDTRRSRDPGLDLNTVQKLR